MRADMTKPEGLLWWKLREANRNGFHFRRQVPLRGYYADFAEHGVRLIIELDGDQHGTDANREHDRIRDLALSGEGYLILRFANNEVLWELDRVFETILRAATQRRPPPGKPRALEPPPF